MVKLVKKGSFVYEIPKENGMRVKAIVYLDEQMAKNEETHEALAQLKNIAYLPGVQGFVVGMPDIHYGYGFPIGGVAATDAHHGVISPGGVGYDINCGVRALRTNLEKKDIEHILDKILITLYNTIPSGVGSRGSIKLSKNDEKLVAQSGALWAVSQGFGIEHDLNFCEDNGHFEGADYSDVSNEAKLRGREQIGTLGAGNHFLEISYVAEIFDKNAASGFGLWESQVIIMFHTGSRGFGYQICEDYLHKMRKKPMVELPDPQLISVYLEDRLGMQYISAMKAAANYAWANRQVITHFIRSAFEKLFKVSFQSLSIDLIYDVSHNIARFEKHRINNKDRLVCVHRKGATRAFPPKNPDIPEEYREIGQPVLIPGDMGRFSYILKGEQEAMTKSFGTTCHGAGRLLSRRKAVKQASGRDIRNELGKRGVLVVSKSQRTLKEEMPEAYKDVSEIVSIVEQNGLARKVVKLVPLGVVKG